MDLKTAEKHASAALAAHKKAGEDLVRVERDVALAARDVESMTKQAKMLDEVLSTHPGLETIQQQLATVLAAEKKLESARRDADAARATARKARVAADAATKTETVARKTLDGARDGVAEFAPPPLSRDDLASDWIAMTDWARAEATRRRAAATEALQAAREAKHAQDALIESQRAACVEAGIEDVTNPRDDCLKALERAKERVTSIELALETAKEIAEMVRGLDEQGVVARELGKHLKANAFERWVLRQALTTLVDGATTILLADARQTVQLRGHRSPQRECHALGTHIVGRRDVPRFARACACDVRPDRTTLGEHRGAAGVDLPRRRLREPRSRNAGNGRDGD
jgi:exonuclease SbcC